ncbi:A/G-specific adenine glycosylase [Flavobacteriaceae bacterium TP-CH-4]|uniref:Adenine DNA glycosylase n=1 Tax=Pelagihabitans pacificus TaxID=2696054 RepID=A0A967E4U7_9FLAO|nr:A/G-specific adenine glycosylase [Pelagihabitans pacificus]NHF58757.1 A/G-specific adenine glycosylase [Pelagihabitans pacificus]
MSFSKIILQWYSGHKRTLPWRGSRDPYKIWLSEIILQQTRVAQGTPYYLKFVEHFPTVTDLAMASEAQVLKLWQGLGYYSRARNLHATAKKVAFDLGGKFPSTYEELMKLKGVGDYTASAIASICFDEPQPVVDGNVYRVLARYFGIDKPINDSKGSTYFKRLAREIMDVENIRDYNQGIMEFGAIQCAPQNPYCLHCPLNQSCVALQKNVVKELPVKLKKTKVRHRYFNYLVPITKNENGANSTLLRQRKSKGIWQNLWEFPLLESEGDIDLSQIKARIPEVLPLHGNSEVELFNESPIVHKLSHQHLYTKFWIVQSNTDLTGAIPFDALEEYAVPVLLADFIKTYKI